MYAIVEIAGQQLKVSKDQHIFVHQLSGNEGDKVEFDDVLLIDNDGKINVGAPAIAGAKVTAKIERHLKGDKVIVFKKKRRKGYQKANGHRQRFTEITISDIIGSGAKAKKAVVKEVDKKETVAKATPKKASAKKTEDKTATTAKATTAKSKKTDAAPKVEKKATAKKETTKAATKKAPAKKKTEGDKDKSE